MGSRIDGCAFKSSMEAAGGGLGGSGAGRAFGWRSEPGRPWGGGGKAESRGDRRVHESADHYFGCGRDYGGHHGRGIRL